MGERRKWPRRIVAGDHPAMGTWWVEEDPSLVLTGNERVYQLVPLKKRKPAKPTRRRKKP